MKGYTDKDETLYCPDEATLTNVHSPAPCSLLLVIQKVSTLVAYSFLNPVMDRLMQQRTFQ